MWTVIILILAGLAIKFMWDLKSQNDKVGSEGGMTGKYRTLIDSLITEDRRTQISEANANSLTLSLNTIGGSTAFFLTQTFGSLTVQWIIKNPIYGEHKLEWEFPEYENQNKMFETMKKDLIEYQTRFVETQSKNSFNSVKSPSKLSGQFPNFEKYCMRFKEGFDTEVLKDEKNQFEYKIPLKSKNGELNLEDWNMHLGIIREIDEKDWIDEEDDYVKMYINCISENGEIIQGGVKYLKKDLDIKSYGSEFNFIYYQLSQNPKFEELEKSAR